MAMARRRGFVFLNCNLQPSCVCLLHEFNRVGTVPLMFSLSWDIREMFKFLFAAGHSQFSEQE